MSITDPISYADWYWKHSVEAAEAISEKDGRTYGTVISQILDGSGLLGVMPTPLQPLFDILSHPKVSGWDNIQRPFLGVISRSVGLVAGEEMARPFKYEAAEKNLTMRIDAATATILQQRKKITDELYKGRMHSEGYADSEINHYYNSRLPYPAFQDIITWARYHGDPYNPKELAWSKFQISPDDWELWEWLSVQKLTTQQVQSLYVRDIWDSTRADDEFARLGWHRDDMLNLHNLAYEIPNAMLLMQGRLMQEKSEDEIADGILKGGIHSDYALDYAHAILTKPATEDIVAYELRRDPSLSNLDTELRRIGIHSNYNGLYKELAYQIPPVADIITMAVREAFTPEIAARFGQYQDLPPDFVEWVGKKGLSKEWAERYWAAHWSLPSPQQGFEMLHRGVIGFDDLNMLMRALDIMPFWRDKLTQIAYRPLSRVDVRRMFALGVLDVAGIRKAYTDIGYNEYNANLMTQFTIEYTKGTPKKLSTADIISAYKKHLIGSGTLRTQLAQAGIDSDDIEPIIRTAQQRREWSDREDNIGTVEYLYKQGRYTEDKTMDELRILGLTEAYIQNLIPQWKAKSVAEKETLWTNAQTLTFMKSGVITIERGKQELTDLGYDEEHINVYLASVTHAT